MGAESNNASTSFLPQAPPSHPYSHSHGAVSTSVSKRRGSYRALDKRMASTMPGSLQVSRVVWFTAGSVVSCGVVGQGKQGVRARFSPKGRPPLNTEVTLPRFINVP